MKVICTDNFARENVDETVVAENIPHEIYASFIAQALNEKFGGDAAPNYYVAKPDDYQPYRFAP